MAFGYAVFQDRIALAAIPALKQYNSMYMMPVCINTVTVGVIFCISIVMAAICRSFFFSSDKPPVSYRFVVLLPVTQTAYNIYVHITSVLQFSYEILMCFS